MSTQSKRAKTYRKYLESPEWARKRADAIKRAGGRCQLCNTGGPLHVHHRTYERLFDELPSDLTVLCPPCHRKHHTPSTSGRKVGRGHRRREIDHEILLVVQTGGLVAWKDIRKQIKAPHSQSWARAQRLLRDCQLAWRHGKLCLYENQDRY